MQNSNNKMYNSVTITDTSKIRPSCRQLFTLSNFVFINKRPTRPLERPTRPLERPTRPLERPTRPLERHMGLF